MAKMAPFTSVALANVPQRTAPRGRVFNMELATILATAVLAKPGQDGASDSKTYNDKKDAQKASGTARRMLTRYFELKPDTLPAKMVLKTRVWGTGNNHDEPPFRWVVYLSTEKVKKEKAAKAAAE